MSISFKTLRSEIIGDNIKFQTPYGERILTYADFTASGKSLNFIEQYMLEIQKYYANTHTEDDMTGEVMTNLLDKSKEIIKKYLNGEENCYVIPAGAGATGAIEYLAKILGIYIPPMSRKRVEMCDENIKRLPVVFIGPYEHHSNILIWKEGLAEVVEIGLDSQGHIDINELKERLKDKKYNNRLKIGSFSAASNVTGIITPVYEIADILHKHNALACFDFAACAPYIRINMNKSNTEYFDAVYIAPHKFLGGPSSSGILVINKKIYNNSVPPTVAGGGTVDYVSSQAYDYIENPEDREMAGTPGIMQIIKSSLVIELKEYIGIERIEEKEKYYTKKVFNRLLKNPNIEFLGPQNLENRLPIFSIKFKYEDKYIHPRFAAKLINDLFGIQTRAGCACAAPYGHRLLEISNENSSVYRYFIKDGIGSVRPGWLRFNIHYTMSEEEVDFICDVLEFVAEHGYLFLNDYILNVKSGAWTHVSKNEKYSIISNFGIEESAKFIAEKCCNKTNQVNPLSEYKNYMLEAKSHANNLNSNIELKSFSEEATGWFYYVNAH